MSTNRTL